MIPISLSNLRDLNVRQNSDLKPIVAKLADFSQHISSLQESTEMQMLAFYLNTGALVLPISQEIIYPKSNKTLVAQELKEDHLVLAKVRKELELVKGKVFEAFKERFIEPRVAEQMLEYKIKQDFLAKNGIFIQPNNHAILFPKSESSIPNVNEINKEYDSNFITAELAFQENLTEQKKLEITDGLVRAEEQVKDYCEKIWWQKICETQPTAPLDLEYLIIEAVTNAFMNIMDIFDSTKTIVLPLQNSIIPLITPTKRRIYELAKQVFKNIYLDSSEKDPLLSSFIERQSVQSSMLYIIEECNKLKSYNQIFQNDEFHKNDLVSMDDDHSSETTIDRGGDSDEEVVKTSKAYKSVT